MRAHDIQSLADTELATQLQALRQQLFATQETVQAGKEKNHARLRELRRDIARLLTVIRQRQERA